MAWEDRTPFDAIESQFNLSHDQVVRSWETSSIEIVLICGVRELGEEKQSIQN